MTDHLNIKVLLLIIIVGLVATSCGEKKSTTNDKSSWPEMKAFHEVMAAVYHPYMDSSNLAPIRERSPELAARAKAWADAPIPSGMKSEVLGPKLRALSEEAQALSVMASKNGNDQALGESLTNLHTHFHEIMEAAHDEHSDGHKD